MICKIDSEKCSGCGICVAHCPLDVLRMDCESQKAQIMYLEDCMTCFICERKCPHHAIFVHPFKEILPDVFPVHGEIKNDF